MNIQPLFRTILRLILIIFLSLNSAFPYLRAQGSPALIPTNQDFVKRLLQISKYGKLDSLEHQFSVFVKTKIKNNQYESGLSALDHIITQKKYSDTLKILAYKNKAILYGQTDLSKKRIAFEKAIQLIESSKTLLELKPIYQLELAKIHLSQSKFLKATNALNTIELSREKDPLKKVEIMGVIGLLYAQMDDTVKSLSTLNQALELAKKNNDYFGLGTINSALGNIHSSKTKDQKKSANHFRKSIHAFQKAGYEHYALGSQVDLGTVYLRDNKLDSALFYLNKAYKKAFEIGSDYDRALCAKELGLLYNKLGEPIKALSFCREAKKLMWSYTSDNFRQSCASCLSKAFETLNEYDSSLYYYKIYHNYADSILNKDETKALAKFNAQLEKQFYIDKQEKLNFKKDQLLKTRKITIVFLAILSLLAVIIFVLIVLGIKSKRKSELLAQQEKSQREYAQKLLQSLENERKRFSMELHDSVGQLLVVAGRKVRDQNYDGVETHIQNALNEVRTISQGMHPYILEKLGLQDAIYNLIFVTDKSSDLFIESEIDLNGIQLGKDQEIHIYRILQELITNCLKHSKSPSLYIEVLQGANHISIAVRDRGVGFNPIDASSGKQTSLGWKTIHERVSLLKGTIHIDSQIDAGTSVSILIPINA